MTDTFCDLSQAHCVPCEGGVPSLTPEEVKKLLNKLPGWQANSEYKEIEKTYAFTNYYQTMAFVNAVAWQAHQEKHHPDLSVHYNRCVVRYSTHAIKGLSKNDFICAAKVDSLFSNH